MRLQRRARGLSRVLPVALGGRRFSSFVFLVAALGLFSVSALRPENLQGLRKGVTDMMAPVLAAATWPAQAAANYVRAATGIASMIDENERLMAENARLRDWYQRAQILKSENESLQKLLNMRLAPQDTYLTARIIADGGNSYVKTLLVLAGTRDGVAKGNAVISGEGLLGRVIEAGDKTARILLMTDINSRIPVQVEGGNNERAILAGRNEGLPTLDFLPRESRIAAGSRIITSGHGGIFPYGLPVGEVVPGENGKWAVQPFADSSHITFVRIVNSSEDPNLREAPR